MQYKDELNKIFSEHNSSKGYGKVSNNIGRTSSTPVFSGFGYSEEKTESSAPPEPAASNYNATPGEDWDDLHTMDFKKKYRTDDYKVIEEMSSTLGIPANALAGVIWNESSGKTDAKNPRSSASGLIQFTEKTANSLGTTTAALRGMDYKEQAPFILKYFQSFGNLINKVKNPYDLHALVFYPRLLNEESDDYVLGSQNGRVASIAKGNAGMDSNKDNQLTKSEVYDWFYKRY